MLQTLSKNWYLLGLCGVLNAITAILYLMMYEAGPDTGAFPGWNGDVVLLCRLSVLAGVCAITAGVWRSAQGVSWALVLNGVALGAYGLIPLVVRGPLSFRLFALLNAVMAMSFGVLAWTLGRSTRPQHRGLFRLAGAASVGFALAFLGLANDWIQLERRPFHPAFFLWVCLFFAFSAAVMLALALWLRSFGTSGGGELLSPSVNPRHAH